MNLYERYCRETFDEAGRLTKVRLRWPAEFNFAYDVADEMARQAPGAGGHGVVRPQRGRGYVFFF